MPVNDDEAIRRAAEQMRREWDDAEEARRKAARDMQDRAEEIRQRKEARRRKNSELLTKFVDWAIANSLPYDVKGVRRRGWRVGTREVTNDTDAWGPSTTTETLHVSPTLTTWEALTTKPDLADYDPEAILRVIADHVARSGFDWP
jgi:hypothetical protein